MLLACLLLVACQSSLPVTPNPAAVPTIPTESLPTPANLSDNINRTLVSQEIAPAPFTPPAPSAQCAPTQKDNSVVVTIGAILPLSSPGAVLAGYAMQTALNIAINDINDSGGIEGTRLRFVTYDSAGTAERAAQFAERLILLDCAVAIIGLYHNTEAMAVTDVAHRYGIPVIIAEASADDITARGYREVFRVAPAFSMICEMHADWLHAVGDYNGDGTLAATLIADNASATSHSTESIVKHLNATGISADVQKVDLPTSDFTSVIARIVARDRLPDAIFITLKGEPALRLQTQLLEAGIGPIRGTLIVQSHTGQDTAQFWTEVPNGIGTIVIRKGAWASTITEHGYDFAIKYDQYMSRWPESHAFAIYDSVFIVAAALRAAETWEGTDLIAALEQTDRAVTNSTITFNLATTADTSEQQTYKWHQWLNSQILYLQYTEPNQPAAAMTVIWPPQHRPSTQSEAVVTIVP